jgi:hypothetical protein
MIILCVGRKEQGKTTLAYHLVRFSPKRVIFDPREDFATSLIVTGDPASLPDDLDDEAVSEVIVQSSRNVIELFEETCFHLAEWLKDNKGEPFGFLIDDSRLAFASKTIPQDFSWMLRSTKLEQSRIVMTTWRIVDIPPEVRSQADVWMVFKTTEPRDLELIAERFGDDAALRVQTLPPHICLRCDDSGPELTISVIENSKAWYVNTKILQQEPKKNGQFVTA